MPFVKQECRKLDHEPCSVGDLCYRHYKSMVEAWRKEPRWSTWHRLLKEACGLSDEKAAEVSALIMLFVEHVIDYEFDKKEENGDI